MLKKAATPPRDVRYRRTRRLCGIQQLVPLPGDGELPVSGWCPRRSNCSTSRLPWRHHLSRIPRMRTVETSRPWCERSSHPSPHQQATSNKQRATGDGQLPNGHGRPKRHQTSESPYRLSSRRRQRFGRVLSLWPHLKRKTRARGVCNRRHLD